MRHKVSKQDIIDEGYREGLRRVVMLLEAIVENNPTLDLRDVFRQGTQILEMERLLRENVVQVYFRKRTTGKGRHMVCTACRKFLNSRYGKTRLKFRKPTQALRYYPHAYNNVIVWDLQKKDWRTVCCDMAIVERVQTPEQWRRSLFTVRTRKKNSRKK